LVVAVMVVETVEAVVALAVFISITSLHLQEHHQFQ